MYNHELHVHAYLKVAVLNEKANEMMMLKFGRIVNLDALEGLTTNKMIGELEDSLQQEETRHINAMNKSEVPTIMYMYMYLYIIHVYIHVL